MISRTTPKPAQCNRVRQPDRAIDRRLAPAVSFWAVESFGSPHGKGRTTKALGVFLPYTCFRQFRGRETEPGMTCRLILSGDGRNIVVFSPRPQNRPHTLSRSSCGNAGRDGGQWGGAGASGGGLTWPVARGGSVQGFPCRHYGRCVLDEHIALRPMPPGAHSPQKAKSIRAERNGRGQKSPDGRPRGRIKI
jgi:hypothetical protein